MAEINDSYILTDRDEESPEDDRSSFLQRLDEERGSSTTIEECPRGVGIFPNHRELMSSHFRLSALLGTMAPTPTQATGRAMRNWRIERPSPRIAEDLEVFSLPTSREALTRTETVWRSMADSYTVSSEAQEITEDNFTPSAISRTPYRVSKAIKKERPSHIKRRRYFLENGKDERREGQ